MNKKILLIAILITILIASSAVMAQRRTSEAATQEKSVFAQFGESFVCIIGCGWPAIVILILPPIAIYIWKKVFSWG
jgi:hypothetical protein